MTLLLERLVRHLRREGARVRPAASPAELAAFEARHRVALDAETRAFFSAIAGGAAAGGLVFLPLAQVRAVADRFPTDPLGAVMDPEYFVFAESRAAVPVAFAFGATRPALGRAPIFRVGGDDPAPLADSFADFLLRYLDRPESLRRREPEPARARERAPRSPASLTSLPRAR